MTEELNATPADEMRKNAAEMCARLNTPSADSVLPQPGSTKEPSRAQFMAGFKPLCACRDVACARRELTSLFLELERDTCKVSATTFEADFTRALGERKWVSNPGPQGLCNVVTVVVIESDESGLLWTYTQTSLAADTTAEFCKGIELNGPMVNSWKAMDRTFSRCRTIKFGL